MQECSLSNHGKNIWIDSDFNSHLGDSVCEKVHKDPAKSVQTSSAVIGCRNVIHPQAVSDRIQQSNPHQSNIREPPQEDIMKPNQVESARSTYLHDNMIMTDVPVIVSSQPFTTITVKANKEKLSINLQTSWSQSQIMKMIAHRTQIPLDKLKLIHKGKMVKRRELPDVVKNKAVFQAIGEQAESEAGLEARDVEVLMKQLSVERNEAIKALRQEGDVLDAILCFANK